MCTKIIFKLVLLFVVLILVAADTNGQQKGHFPLKSGGVIRNSSSPDIILTFNQIDPSQFPTVSCFVAVVDESGQPVTGLTNTNFGVQEDNQSVSFTVTPYGGTRLDVSVALVLDNSGSINDSELGTINQAANRFVGLMQANDRGAVFKFTENVALVQDFTSNKTLLNYSINAPRISGNMTALYDAIYDALFRTKLETNRRAVIALTDGQENSSSHSFNDVIQLAVNSQIPVFTIGLGTSVNANELTNIAVQTGGLYFPSANVSNLLAIFESIGGTLENQYEIEYTTPNPARNGTVRTVSVTSTYGADSDQKSRIYRAPVEGEILVDLPDNVPCFPGQTLVIQVLAGNLTGAGIYSYQFNLAYDHSVLQATRARSSGTLTASWGNPIFNTPSAGQVQVGGYGTVPLSGSGVLVEIEFNVVGNDGDYSVLSFIDFLFNNGFPPVRLEDGFVWVTALEISGRVNYYSNNLPVSGVTVSPSGGASPASSGTDGIYVIGNLSRGSNYTITSSKPSDTDIGDLTILTHDAAYVAQAAFDLRTLTDDEKIAGDVDNNGQLQLYDAALIAEYAVDLPKSSASHVGEWQFTPSLQSYTPLEGNMPEQNFIAILLGDVTGNWSGGSTILALKSFQSEQNVVKWEEPGLLYFGVPEAMSNSDVISVDIELTFEPEVLAINNIEIASELVDCQLVKNFQDGSLKVGFFQRNPSPSPKRY